MEYVIFDGILAVLMLVGGLLAKTVLNRISTIEEDVKNIESTTITESQVRQIIRDNMEPHYVRYQIMSHQLEELKKEQYVFHTKLDELILMLTKINHEHEDR